jgi:uncharacterized protein YndB with AHSA1/START domain
MRRTRVQSEAIRSVGHSAATLEVEFTTGRVYRYFDVPVRVFEALMSAESHGEYFNRHVRNDFGYAEVRPEGATRTGVDAVRTGRNRPS